MLPTVGSQDQKFPENVTLVIHWIVFEKGRIFWQHWVVSSTVQYPWHLIRLLLQLTAIYGPYLGERWLVILIVVVEVVYILSITHRKKIYRAETDPTTLLN